MSITRIQPESQVALDVLIQGAGIAGLTLAIALEQRGYRVELVERSTGLADAGAGIWMAPNPMQVFSRLGFAAKVIDAGWPITLLRLQDSKSGDLQVTDMSEISREFGFETIALHRAALQRVLHAQLQRTSIRFGCELLSLHQSAGQVTANLSDGSSVAATIVVGADGINSQIRRMAELGGEKRYSGSSSYRAIARGARILTPDAAHEAYEIWSAGCRLGFSKINADDYYWYMTFDAPAGESVASPSAHQYDSLFRSHFPRWIDLMHATRPEEILRTDISDLRPVPKWSSGRIGLIGDAAHATTPNLGQGGAMAVEDAFELAESFVHAGLNESAWQRFEQRRRPKVDWTVSTSWSIGRICHTRNPLFRLIRNLAVKNTPRSMSRKQVQRLYSLQLTPRSQLAE